MLQEQARVLELQNQYEGSGMSKARAGAAAREIAALEQNRNRAQAGREYRQQIALLEAQAKGRKAEERRLKMAERMKEIYDQQRDMGVGRKTAMGRARRMAGLEDMVERRKDRKEGGGPIADSLAQVGGGGRSMMGSVPQLTEARKQTTLLQQIVRNTGGGQQLERLAMSGRIQPGVGYTFSRGPGGASLAIPRQRGGKGGSGMALPFACSVVAKTDEKTGKKTEYVQIARNGGVLLDVMGFPYEIPWAEGDIVEVGGAETPGKFSVCLGWQYAVDYSREENRLIECKTVGFSAGGDLEEDAALKPVITPIKGEDETGESQIVLAVGERKQNLHTIRKGTKKPNAYG